MGSQHAAVVSSLSAIFKALGTGSVPYLPKVLPVLLAVARGADEPLREYALEQLTQLVRSVRQHIRRFLPELLALLQVRAYGCVWVGVLGGEEGSGGSGRGGLRGSRV